jgi:predicted nucleotidyltransferase
MKTDWMPGKRGHYLGGRCKGDSHSNFMGNVSDLSRKKIVTKTYLIYTLNEGVTMRNNISDIKQNLSEISQIIAETVPVESIYLFGSYAYGTPNKDSDLDLYIVFKDELPMREIEALTAVRIAIDSVKNKSVDLLGLKQNRFHDRKQYATLERKIARDGIKLYG